MKSEDKFPLGKVVVTKGVSDKMVEDLLFELFVQDSLLLRHVKGDWGDLGAGDKKENMFSLTNGFRLLSAYEHETLPKIWIITEADRSATTILFPGEY